MAEDSKGDPKRGDKPKKSRPVYLAPPKPYTAGSYTVKQSYPREVQFIMPGAPTKKVPVIRINTGEVPQPFLQPEVLEAWQEAKTDK